MCTAVSPCCHSNRAVVYHPAGISFVESGKVDNLSRPSCICILICSSTEGALSGSIQDHANYVRDLCM